MITVLEAINLSTEFLHKKGVQSPRINAELLLADILKCKRLELYLSFDRPLKQTEVDLYRELSKRRSTFEPLQYIIGSVEFYGLEFKITPEVLIPRQETEILVESIIKCCSESKKLSILDIGCGCGNIGISLAVNLPNSNIFCTDVSNSVINLAKENTEKLKVKSKINFFEHDILNEELDFISEVDVIVSNPPYVSKNDFITLQKEIRDYEPRAALTDEANGFKFFNKISEKSTKKLILGGRLFFEVGDSQSEKVEKIMIDNGFSDICIIKDYQDIERVISGVKK